MNNEIGFQFRPASLAVTLALAGALSLATLPAQAAEPGLYATANIGAGFLGSETQTYTAGSTSTSASVDFDTGFAAGGTFGYRYDGPWAAEVEVMYRTNDLEPLTVPGLGTFDEGNFASLSFALNGLYNFSPASNPDLNLYAGVGIVYLQEIDIDFEAGGQETSFESDDVAFQLKFGGRYDLSDRWFIDGGATYLAASSVKMEFAEDRSQTIESDYSHWSASLGIGWRF